MGKKALNLNSVLEKTSKPKRTIDGNMLASEIMAYIKGRQLPDLR